MESEAPDLQCLQISVVVMLPLWPTPKPPVRSQSGEWEERLAVGSQAVQLLPDAMAALAPWTWGQRPSYLGISFPSAPKFTFLLNPDLVPSLPGM